MQYRMKMSAEQAKAIAEWSANGDGFADVLLDEGDDDRIVVGQGDERATFNTDGVQCCERCGALDGEELQGGACYSCGLGHEDDPEAASTHEPEGDRIAREGAAMLAAARDIDYDPAAEDEDGVPIFSDATRAAAQDDPRGEADR